MGRYVRAFLNPVLMRFIEIIKIIAALFYTASAAKFENRDYLK